jgi:TIR domain-containing protein
VPDTAAERIGATIPAAPRTRRAAHRTKAPAAPPHLPARRSRNDRAAVVCYSRSATEDARGGIVPGIFICYRRDDNRHAAGRLYDSLAGTFPRQQIFLDIDNIAPGSLFPKVIQERLAEIDVTLVLIGPNWLNANHPDGTRRLDDPADFVRMEIEACLQKGVRVIPVLFDRATMPKATELPLSLQALTMMQSVELNHVSWHRDAEHLISWLRQYVKADAGRRDVTDAPSRTVKPQRVTRGAEGPIVAPDKASRWTARLVSMKSSSFSIRLRCGAETRLLQYKSTFYTFFDYVRLDGVKVKTILWPTGEKNVEFKIGSHPERFRLKFKMRFSAPHYALQVWTGKVCIFSRAYPGKDIG